MSAETPRPRWWAWVGIMVAVYGIILLGLFVGWNAALIGCVIACGASEATRART